MKFCHKVKLSKRYKNKQEKEIIELISEKNDKGTLYENTKGLVERVSCVLKDMYYL